MKKKFLTAMLMALLCGKNVSAQGFLRVKNTKIENDLNKDFVLRGIGLGGYMLQEGYMYDLSKLGQQHKIREKITSLVGEDKAADFYKKWLHNFIQKADIDSLAAWGFNSVRLPMHYDLFTLPVAQETIKGENTWLPIGFQMVDSLLSWCGQDHIYLILDLHAAPGGQGNDLPISDRYPDQPSLWESQENQDKTVALWKQLAHRYKNEKWIGGYDILNETNWGFDDTTDKRGASEKGNIPLRNLLVKITKAIRSEDKKHIVFLEGNGFANNYNGIFPLWDKNIVVSFHKYWNPNTQEVIQKFLDYRTQYNVPLWLGESGENDNVWFAEATKLMEKNDIGWCWWPLKKMGASNPLQIKKPDNYQLFVDYCTGKSNDLDRNVARQILSDWLENLKVQNNTVHHDVIDALMQR